MTCSMYGATKIIISSSPDNGSVQIKLPENTDTAAVRLYGWEAKQYAPGQFGDHPAICSGSYGRVLQLLDYMV